jgi:hypothetical protein
MVNGKLQALQCDGNHHTYSLSLVIQLHRLDTSRWQSAWPHLVRLRVVGPPARHPLRLRFRLRLKTMVVISTRPPVQSLVCRHAPNNFLVPSHSHLQTTQTNLRFTFSLPQSSSSSYLTMSAAMDVYAPPYVPLAFRKVNDAPAHVVPCLPAPWINYDAYVRTFAGTAFLASQTQPRRIPGADPQPSTADTQSLDQDTYLPYFRETLSKETLAREQEVRNQAVFQTSLVPTVSSSLQFKFMFPLSQHRVKTPCIDSTCLVFAKQASQLRWGTF